VDSRGRDHRLLAIGQRSSIYLTPSYRKKHYSKTQPVFDALSLCDAVSLSVDFLVQMLFNRGQAVYLSLIAGDMCVKSPAEVFLNRGVYSGLRLSLMELGTWSDLRPC